MNMKKTFGAISTAFVVCCGIFVGTALAQDDDLWGDYNSSSTTEMSLPESDAAPGWEPLDEPASASKPAKAAKPEKPPKAAKAPKPAKEPKQRVEASGGDDRTFNVFVNTGWGFGQGGQLVRELNAATINNTKINKTHDYYINMGGGWRFEAGMGYMAAPNVEARFSADVNLGLLAPDIKESFYSNGALVRQEEVKYSYLYSWGVRAMAVPQFEMLELFDMYLGAGMSLNFAGGSIDSSFNGQNVVYDMQFGWFIPGFCGLLGFVLPLSDEMDFLSELQFESKSFTLNKLKLVKNTQQTNPGSPEYKENNEAIGNAPQKYPGSNWGLRVGIRYWFGL